MAAMSVSSAQPDDAPSKKEVLPFVPERGKVKPGKQPDLSGFIGPDVWQVGKYET